MEGKKVSPNVAGGMIMHLEVFPEEIHVIWNEVLDHKVGKPITGSIKKKSNNSLGQLKSIYHAMWLRDNDQGPLSRHPGNGQRLFNIVDIPEDLYIKNASIDFIDNDFLKEEVKLEFGSMHGNYSFKSNFDADFLRLHGYSNDTSMSNSSWVGELSMSKQKLNNIGISKMFNDSGVKLWDKKFFQDISEEKNSDISTIENSSFKNGLVFHNYETIVALNMEWKKDYKFVGSRNGKSNEKYQNERKDKFEPLFAFLKDFVEYGFMLLEGIPVKDGELLNIPSLFDGYVRETNYGPLFDVQAKKNPNNLAFTNLAVTPHTDNPYRNPVPSIQILHCLKNECDGGLSGLVDGFMAAEKIRNLSDGTMDCCNYFQLLSHNFIPYEYHNPSYFSSATSTVHNEDTVKEGRKVTKQFSYNNQCARLCHRQPVIQVDDRGMVQAIAFNNRSASAFDFRSNDQTGKSIMPEFYEAYRKFAQIIFHDDMQLNIKLKPGQAMIFNNRRVLHARTSFSLDTSKSLDDDYSPRHFQGCYSDKDAIFSKYLLMKDNLGYDTEENCCDT